MPESKEDFNAMMYRAARDNRANAIGKAFFKSVDAKKEEAKKKEQEL